ncbi:MAG TPA: hypothetical protein VFD65_03440, partial [Chitinophagales bacterium]|nr:hypothetical protein [Chitinophagales bacterium]
EDIEWKKMPAQLKLFSDNIIFGEIGKGLAANLFKYFKKDFHPNDIDDRYLIDEFFKDKEYA